MTNPIFTKCIKCLTAVEEGTMNVIFGIWRPQGFPIAREDLEAMAVHTHGFASDAQWFRIASDIGFGVQSQFTHERSRLGVQPASDAAGNLLVYDGRLDNYRELLRSLDLEGEDTPDSEIVLCAYRKWGDDCFFHFIGDWALALWNSQTCTLYLARDHAGTRTLHYLCDSSGTVLWSTYLDSLQQTSLLEAPDEVYVASYIAMLPSYGRSPYRNVRCVLPGHVLRITRNSASVKQFWTPMVNEQLSYRVPEDYDSHFLELFQRAVARRTPTSDSILAELSGGMDSTSIVCVSDKLRNTEDSESGLVDTISYFDDTDPSWNERPYVTVVEQRRGKPGFHMDSSRYRRTYDTPPHRDTAYLYPGTDRNSEQWSRDLLKGTSSKQYRVIVSGIGGDELTGGVPDLIPQLADYLVEGHLIRGTALAISMCLAQREALTAVMPRAARYISGLRQSASILRDGAAAPWFTAKTCQLCDLALAELPTPKYQPFSTLPSAIGSCRSWWYMLRTQPHLRPSGVYRYEYRYPYLDRDLVEFLLRVPLIHLATPGRRRAMMRRALRGIVPEEIIERRRKAFLLQSPLSDVARLASHFEELSEDALLCDLGFINRERFRGAIQAIATGADVRWWPLILRTVGMEIWLRSRFTKHRSVTHGRNLTNDEKIVCS